MLRDPRDVAASYVGKSWVSNDLDLVLDRLRRQYLEFIKLEEVMPDRFFRTIRLEDITSDFANQKEELCAFLDLAPEGFDGSVSFESSSFGRWTRNFSKHEQQRVEDALQDVCAHYGYA